jgi:predicted DNA-binding protein
MIRSGKKLADLETVINNKDNFIIREAIGLLRDDQPFEGAIGILTSLYNNTDDYLIRKAVEEFMNDLKDQSASEEVMNEIRKKWKADTISMSYCDRGVCS